MCSLNPGHPARNLVPVLTQLREYEEENIVSGYEIKRMVCSATVDDRIPFVLLLLLIYE
jgi:hypothetical protein